MKRCLGQVDGVKITVILDNQVEYGSSFYAQHGISLLIEIDSAGIHKNIMMDVGQSSKTILYNMALMGINPKVIDAIFISHCHPDHTKGLVGLLKAINKDLPVIGHPSIFRDTFVLEPFLRKSGIPAKNGRKAIIANGGQLFLSDEVFEIMPGVLSSGEIERTVDFEDQSIGVYNLKDGRIAKDEMIDDMSIILNLGVKGLVIVVGCSHAGIINIIKHAIKITGIAKIAAVVGGFHLINASKARIKKTAIALKEMGIGFIVPGHCTGFDASKEIAHELGDNYSQLYVGKTIRIY